MRESPEAHLRGSGGPNFRLGPIGHVRSRAAVPSHSAVACARFAASIDDATRRLVLDPQTSGGLLVGVPAAHAAAWDKAREARGVRAWKVGEAIAGEGVSVA